MALHGVDHDAGAARSLVVRERFAGGALTYAGELTYTPRRSDFLWMYSSSWAALLAGSWFVFFGLLFIAAPFVAPSGTYGWSVLPIGLAFLVLGPCIGPVSILMTTGATGVAGREIRLAFNVDGIQGWPPAIGRVLEWSDLRRVGLESRLVMIEFETTYGGRRGWIPIPYRVLSASELETLLRLLEAQTPARDLESTSLLSHVLSATFYRGGPNVRPRDPS
jgi:hypothetical protein